MSSWRSSVLRGSDFRDRRKYRATALQPAPARYPPIADYALISDCQSAALVSVGRLHRLVLLRTVRQRPVSRGSSIGPRWLFPCSSPTDAYTVVRRYLPSTNVLETRFTTTRCRVGAHRLPRTRSRRRAQPESAATADSLRTRAGALPVDFRPRFDYGRTIPRLKMQDDRNGVVYGGADGLVLQADLPMNQVELCGCRSEVASTPQRNTSSPSPVHHRTSCTRTPSREKRPAPSSPRPARSGRTGRPGAPTTAVPRTCGAERTRAQGADAEPTGAIVAAPTTSLPETPGGTRNWDYRYCWLRDAALDLYALSASATRRKRARSWPGSNGPRPAARGLQIMYGVGGERYLPEHDIDTLEGYRGSRPVRVGNAAAEQFQLDVYGYLLDTAWLYHGAGGDISNSFWEFLCGAVDVVAERWMLPDEGIWEVHGSRRGTSSRPRSWRGSRSTARSRLARARNLPGDIEAWKALRREIRSSHRDARCRSGNRGVRAGIRRQRAVDASNLLAPLVRFAAAPMIPG